MYHTVCVLKATIAVPALKKLKQAHVWIGNYGHQHEYIIIYING